MPQVVDCTQQIFKVGICGTHGTGKTTLMRELAKHYNLPEDSLIPEVTTDVFKMCAEDPSLVINQDATMDAQLMIMIGQLAAENSAKPSNGFLLTDRTIYDGLAYTVRRIFQPRFLKQAGGAGNILQALMRRTRSWLEEVLLDKYDVIFYLPVQFPLVADGVRNDDTEFQRQIESMLYGMFYNNDGEERWTYSKKVVTLIGNSDERLKHAINVIDSVRPKTTSAGA